VIRALVTFAIGTTLVGPHVTIVPARGRDLEVHGITRTDAAPAHLVAWTREIEQLHRGRYVAAIGRFSTTPRIEDLAGLTIDKDDVSDLRKCRPGDCGVKLSAPEIEWIRGAADVQVAFRQVVLARAQDYLAAGLKRAPAYHDRRKPISPQAEYEEVSARIALEPRQAGRALPFFDAYPAGDSSGVESFLYWSKETLGGGKPIVSITHAAIFREVGAPTSDAASAGRQVWASHYLTASLSFTLMAGADSGARHLVYVRRLRTDAFEGAFGRFVRSIVERRIRAEAPTLLDQLRLKLEGGAPPEFDSTS
jgi:hypothetical protein